MTPTIPLGTRPFASTVVGPEVCEVATQRTTIEIDYGRGADKTVLVFAHADSVTIERLSKERPELDFSQVEFVCVDVPAYYSPEQATKLAKELHRLSELEKARTIAVPSALAKPMNRADRRAAAKGHPVSGERRTGKVSSAALDHRRDSRRDRRALGRVRRRV